MWGVVAEAAEDFAALRELIRRIKNDHSIPVKGRGFSGSGELMKKGPDALKLTADDGATRFIVCQDADGTDHDSVRNQLQRTVAKECGFGGECCIVVPVQEFEAWIIADELAITRVLSGFNMEPHPHPENIASPKEYLVRKSRMKNSRPRYMPSMHNKKIAEHLRIEIVSAKCPSFQHFSDFVTAA